jgi:hypothetical protein
MEEEVNPVARERLERSLLIDALVEAEELKIDQEALQSQVNEILTELFYSGNYQEMQKEMGQEELTRAISREGVARTMNAQIQERLKLIATGQPIPEDEPEPEENTDAEPAEDAGDMEQPESATADDTEGDEAGSSEESTAAQDEEKTDQEESEGEEHADES